MCFYFLRLPRHLPSFPSSTLDADRVSHIALARFSLPFFLVPLMIYLYNLCIYYFFPSRNRLKMLEKICAMQVVCSVVLVISFYSLPRVIDMKT